MLDLVAYIYGVSAIVASILAVYCMTRDHSWRRHSLGDILGPVLVPGINTAIAVCGVFILWDDLRKWRASALPLPHQQPGETQMDRKPDGDA